VTTDVAPTDSPPATVRGGLLRADVDRSGGRISASGHLTPQGADLLGGTADSLRTRGHRRVVVDLLDVRSADAAGLAALAALRSRFAAHGAELVVEHAPTAG
jgi:anti-anti-sigma regulatory factor